MSHKLPLYIIFSFITGIGVGAEAIAAQDYEEIYSLEEIRYPHLVAITRWGDEYVSLFEPANGKVSHRACTFENVRILPVAPPEVTACLFVEKSEIVDTGHLGAAITFKYSHDNVRENKSQTTFQRGSTTSSTFSLALKASEPTSGVGVDIGGSRTATTTRQATSTSEANNSGKDQVSFDVTFPQGGLYLLSTLHVIKKRTYPIYNITANMNIEIEYVDVDDAKTAYAALTTQTCFKSVFLAPGIDGQTLKRLVLRGDVDTTGDMQHWMFYGAMGDVDQTEQVSDGKIKVRKFIKRPVRNEPTFLADPVTTLNLTKRINIDAARVIPGGISSMIPGIDVLPGGSLATRIASYV